ncbi:hypothetical protein MRB53_005673 [Persea americana]|uniref:Uncharacterized protein n=1 Tax=Persea americana TaxID=3435 RepID=A0ACC2MER0_PERAE|nr:hypothetical protein MRB53_005673 [Persea americana]
MSIATSFSSVKLPSSSSCPCSSSSPSSFRFPSKPHIIRSSKAEGPLRRPLAPPIREPSSPLKPIAPSPLPQPSSSPSMPSAPPKPFPDASAASTVVTLEFQRKMAKEIQEYFRQKKLEEANQGPFFGFIAKNEIGNGRWAMFGFAVGLLTEYATGSDFVAQLKIILSNFGIVDLD